MGSLTVSTEVIVLCRGPPTHVAWGSDAPNREGVVKIGAVSFSTRRSATDISMYEYECSVLSGFSDRRIVSKN